MFRPYFSVFYQKLLVLNHPKFHTSSAAMSRDIFNEIAELNDPKVHIKNKANVNRLINQLISGGRTKLQVVSDFDRTITKQHENGKSHLSSFGIFARCKSLPKSYLESEQLLNNKYLPIEVDPTIPFVDKKALMVEWWTLSEKLLVGLQVPNVDIDEVVKELGPALRDNCVESFRILHDAGVPILVFSAGLGDAVVSVLKHFGVLLPNVKVISNFLMRDAHGVIQGFGDKTIHVFNKNEQVIEGTEYYELVRGRSNVILLGDSVGDAGMADGVPNSNVLKIGFLYDHINGNLPNYLDHFDIVLEDDQTMNVLNSILHLIK